MNENLHHIGVIVETQYISEQSSPALNYYVFAYTITLSNHWRIPAKLLRRHWLITDANCKIKEVYGDGVVGEQPHIMPGESYQYTSSVILETPVGFMQGSYEMLADNGIKFNAPVPVFKLSTPNSIH